MIEQSSNPAVNRHLQVLVLAALSPATEELVDALQRAGCDTYTVGSLEDISAWLAAMRFDAVLVGEDFADELQTVRDIRGVEKLLPVVVPAFSFGQASAELGETAATVSAAEMVATIAGLIEEAGRRPRQHPVNVEKFLSMVDSDRSFFEAMSAEFLQDAVVKLPELQSAVSAGDSRRVEFLAHGLKSVLGIFGAEEAAAAARDLESAGREGRTDDAGRILVDFLEHMGVVDRQLRKILART